MATDYFGKYRGSVRRAGEIDVTTRKAMGAGRVAEANIDKYRKQTAARLQTLTYLNQALQNIYSNIEQGKEVRKGLQEFGITPPERSFLTGVKEAVFGPNLNVKYGAGEAVTGREMLMYQRMGKVAPEYQERYGAMLHEKRETVAEESLASAQRQINEWMSNIEGRGVVEGIEKDWMGG